MVETTIPKPFDEDARLLALHTLGILNSPPEPEFDRITRIAAALFDVPMALVSLIDADRQWFKSCYGFEGREGVRQDAICAHTIVQAGPRPLVVPDATQDPRFEANPFVTGQMYLRFYAGAPLSTADGFRVGTLCVFDRVPHPPLSPDQESMLRDLADMASELLELRRVNLKNAKSLTQEIEVAAHAPQCDPGFRRGAVARRVRAPGPPVLQGVCGVHL